MKDRSNTFKIYGIQIYLLFEKGYMKTLHLPDPPEGKYFLEEQDTGIFMEAEEKHWYICSSSPGRIFEASGRNVMRGEIHDGSRYRILMKNGSCFFHAALIRPEQMIYHNYQLVKKQRLCIGRASDNDLVCSEDWVSRQHALLMETGDGIKIKDLDSLFGTYVNGKRIRECALNTGDTIFIMGLKIVIGPGFLSINHGNMDIRIRNGALKLLNEKSVSRAPERMQETGEDNLFSRFPRRKKKFQAEEIKIEAPSFSLSDNQAPMLLSMGSSMVIGGSAVLGGNISSVLSMLMFPIMNRMYSDKEKKEYEKLRISKYTEYLARKSREIQQEKLREETILNENYPPLNVVVSYPTDRKKLWNRSYREEDFLKLRIGHGQLPMTAEIKYPEKKFRLTEDQLEEDMYQLAEKKVFLDHVPVMLPLTENFVCGVVGSQKEKEEFLKQLLMQIVFQHSYDEVRIVFLADKEILDNMEAVRYLPHLWNDERTFRFLAADTASAYLIGEYLNRQIEPEFEKPRELEELLKEKPYYVVLAWSKPLLDNMEILKKIMKEEKNHGVSIITFFEDIPQYVREIIHLYPDRPNEISYLGDSDDYGENFSGMTYIIIWLIKCCKNWPVSG
ncbi:MAG: FHA domain-containing protein [Eubacteriales bacterium]|nr:FHA domain-containing protein [Eubacteriales bacterium]